MPQANTAAAQFLSLCKELLQIRANTFGKGYFS